MKSKALKVVATLVGITAVVGGILYVKKRIDDFEIDLDDLYDEEDNELEKVSKPICVTPWQDCENCNLQDRCLCREMNKCPRSEEEASECAPCDNPEDCPYFKDKSVGARDGVFFN